MTRTDNDVDQKRKDRDNDRVGIDPSDIDMNIVNDYPTLEDFLENEGRKLVMKLEHDL